MPLVHRVLPHPLVPLEEASERRLLRRTPRLWGFHMVDSKYWGRIAGTILGGAMGYIMVWALPRISRVAIPDWLAVLLIAESSLVGAVGGYLGDCRGQFRSRATYLAWGCFYGITRKAWLVLSVERY